MDQLHCHCCGKATVVPGQLVVAEGSTVYGFAPAGTHTHVKLRVAFNACTSCGHLWASVAPQELQAAIAVHGTALIRQHLAAVEFGPHYGLPDIPEARQAADGAAEIDALFLAGNRLEALRRFRQLTEKTWDEAHAIVSKWPELSRGRKLALFGWHPKGKLDDEEETQLQAHPMHDRLLDG